MSVLPRSEEDEKLEKRMKHAQKRIDIEASVKAKKEQDLLEVKVVKADLDELMTKMGISDSEKASRVLRQAGGNVKAAIRACIFDFPELSKN